jgi:hypothetical protein
MLSRARMQFRLMHFRNIRQLVEHQFDYLTVDTFYAEHLPQIMGYLYQGVATKATKGATKNLRLRS